MCCICPKFWIWSKAKHRQSSVASKLSTKASLGTRWVWLMLDSQRSRPRIQCENVKILTLMWSCCFFPCLLDTYWQGSGPLFFYTGNEGPIDNFMDNSGFVFTLAKQFNALVVFAEHVSDKKKKKKKTSWVYSLAPCVYMIGYMYNTSVFFVHATH